ncbi:hypothetical protein POTOM_040360 [Populus tomentosa]|uniref:Uncharacterized protein n=1 Tax=Populus tomentosa TaxID=118781 RepID=A0A8X7YP49_POPTO|nr:hypothetical protein POTOM_040360 [Populus tomentosa]
MACSHLTMWVSSKASLSDTTSLCFLSSPNLFQLPSSPAANNPSRPSSATPIHRGLRELRSCIDSVKNTQKITEAKKLVAAAKLRTEDIDIPLTKVRPVKKVALVVVTGDRGLCGGFNNYILKKAEARIEEFKIDRFIEGTGLPAAKEAQAIADDVFSLFSDPVIHTLLPLSPKAEICDVNGVCVDAAEDEFFRLKTKDGKLTVERGVSRTETSDFSPILQFEQDPVQIRDVLLPSYLNSRILKALQKLLASELAGRQRRAKITGEILEIVAGANALT